MMVVEAPVQLSVPTLLQAIRQLPPSELDRLLTQAHLIQQEQAGEAALLALIHRQLSAAQQRRLQMLSAKAEEETITAAERVELLQLVAQVETLDGERAEALLALAQRRQVSLRQLLRDLALEQPVD
jgi:hypothetical protein